MRDITAEKAIFFLGFFTGKSTTTGHYGLYGDDWIDLVREASNATGFLPKWLIKMDEEAAEKAALVEDEVPF